MLTRLYFLLSLIKTGRLCLALILALLTTVAQADENPLYPPIFNDQTFFTFSILHNKPWQDTANHYHATRPSFSLGYRFFYKRAWLVGVDLGFKHLKQSEAEEMTHHFFLFEQECLYGLRISDPYYFFIGGKVNHSSVYIKRLGVFKRDFGLDSEVGVGVVGELVYLNQQGPSFSLSLQRWRGTGTNDNHGVEFGIGVLVPTDAIFWRAVKDRYPRPKERPLLGL